MGHAYAAVLADPVRLDLVGPFQVVAFSEVLHPAEDPSSFEDRDFVENVVDAEDVANVADEVALVVDVDVDYEDAGSGSVAEPELVASYTATQTENI